MTSSSDLCIMSAEVPQGSVLGSLLFIIYINDIADRLFSHCRIFADDTSFGDSSKNITEIKMLLIAIFYRWTNSQNMVNGL